MNYNERERYGDYYDCYDDEGDDDDDYYTHLPQYYQQRNNALTTYDLLQFSLLGKDMDTSQSTKRTKRCDALTRPPRSQTYPGTSACLAGGPCRIATFAGLSP